MEPNPRPPLGAIHIVFLCTTAALLFGLVLMRFLLVPAFVNMFRDFGGDLPFVTRAAISPVPTASVAALSIVLGALGFWRRRASLLVVATVLAGLAILFTIAAMYAPIFEVAGAVRAE